MPQLLDCLRLITYVSKDGVKSEIPHLQVMYNGEWVDVPHEEEHPDEDPR